MCSGSKNKVGSSNSTMVEPKFQSLNNGVFSASSILLELSASDDVENFKKQVEEKGFAIDEPSFWYGRGISSKKMGFEKRTPLMIASMFGSTNTVKYIISTGKADLNRLCGSDRSTALHCAAAGASGSSIQTIKLLLDGSANVNSIDANGKKPIDLFASACKTMSNSAKKAIEMLLKGGDLSCFYEEEDEKVTSSPTKEATEKKEYPVDISLPDINSGMYGTDEFRMYTFKVKPCSRAYSHDWTECPFVHPGENARRRDPRKYPYSCVPCPEFRKGTCNKADSCEYAHGVFESWLHPAQYRTRLCKDETGCSRKVCFFAHKPDELRPVYASTGSGVPSPRSGPTAADMTMMSPLALGSSPMSSPVSSPKNGNLWQNKINLTPPALQLPGSRLKASLSARDLDFEMELLELEKNVTQLQHQQLIEEFSRLSSPGYVNRAGEMNHLQSPTGLQMRQNLNQLRSSYPTALSSSPVKKPSSFGFDSSSAVAAAVMNSRSAAFANRSQSFIDRTAPNRLAGPAMNSHFSDWNSPEKKVDWGMKGDELNKLRKSASFGIRNNAIGAPNLTRSAEEPDVSWVNSLVKDVATESFETVPSWMEQIVA